MSARMGTLLSYLGMDFLAEGEKNRSDSLRFARVSMSQLGRWLTVDCNTAWLPPASPCSDRLLPGLDEWNDLG